VSHGDHDHKSSHTLNAELEDTISILETQKLAGNKERFTHFPKWMCLINKMLYVVAQGILNIIDIFIKWKLLDIYYSLM